MGRLQRSLVGLGLALVFFAAAGGSFLAGKTYGVWEYIYFTAPGKGWYTVTQLRSLRAGRTDEVIQGLESQLNMEIAQHWIYRPKMVEALMSPEQRRLQSMTPNIMAQLAEYRDQYPWAIPEFVTKNPTMQEWALYNSSQVRAALDFYRARR
jgi:hypothetical protein